LSNVTNETGAGGVPLESTPNWRSLGWHGSGDLTSATRRSLHRTARNHVHHISAERTSLLTVGELIQRAKHMAAGFSALGVRRGDTVITQLPNWVEAAITLRAVAALGAVYVPLVVGASPDEVLALCNLSGARLAVSATTWRGQERNRHLAAFAASRITSLVVVGDDVPTGAARWSDVERTAVPGTIQPTSRVDTDAPAFMTFTSGSTGAPKVVRHSQNTLLAEARGRAVNESGVADQGEVVLNLLPPGHIADLIVQIRAAVFGSPIVTLDFWDPELAARLIELHQVTSTMLVPFHLRQLMESSRGHDISSIASVMVGASGVSPALIEQANTQGWPAFRSFGATEHPTVTASSPLAPIADRSTTDGRPLAGNELRIVDGDLHDVEPGNDGEILTRGPERALGYLDPGQDDSVFLPGGWFRSGDLGHVDRAGRLTVTDRLKDIIIRGGVNISAKEIEDALLTNPDIAEVAVVAMPDESFGERACAFVVPASGRQVTMADITSHLAHEGLAKRNNPERLILLDALPRNTTGKVRKVDLRAQLKAERSNAINDVQQSSNSTCLPAVREG
jgi:acyl-CoA synthetase (AMP-forming)/AMP-acid ligase II